jgi:hypothetical protein
MAALSRDDMRDAKSAHAPAPFEQQQGFTDKRAGLSQRTPFSNSPRVKLCAIQRVTNPWGRNPPGFTRRVLPSSGQAGAMKSERLTFEGPSFVRASVSYINPTRPYELGLLLARPTARGRVNKSGQLCNAAMG